MKSCPRSRREDINAWSLKPVGELIFVVELLLPVECGPGDFCFLPTSKAPTIMNWQKFHGQLQKGSGIHQSIALRPCSTPYPHISLRATWSTNHPAYLSFPYAP